MKVRELIQAGFVTASSKYPDIQEAWVETSYRIGARLPNSMLVHSIQKAGHLDIVIRCMEDEFSATNPDMAFNYQMLFSELWIGQVYEFCQASEATQARA